MTILVSPLLILFLAKCLFAISSGALQAARFSKTSATAVATTCLLSIFTPYGNQISVKMACSIQCMETTNCRFFCIGIAGLDCDLYNVYAAKRFLGHPFGKAYSVCYTSRSDLSDVIKADTLMTYSTIHDPLVYKPSYATDGYAECGVCSYFITEYFANSHVQFDLGAVTRVKSVIVQGSYANLFNNIVIYLGNTTTFNSHPVYATQPGAAAAHTTSVLSGNNAIGGRYLTIFSPDSEFLGFCELQVNRI